MKEKLFRVVLAVAFLIPLSGSNWSIDSYPDSLSPGSSFGITGSSEPEVAGTIQVRYKNATSGVGTFLCSNAFNEETGAWDEEFDPSEDYDPPGEWPETPTQNESILFRLMEGTIQRDLKSVQCAEVE